MFGGFLGGLISTAAEDMQAERDRVRADEDRVLASKKAYLDDLVKGVHEGRVRPEIYLQALKDSMAASTPASQRTRAKGGRGFMGGTEAPYMQLLDMIVQGRDPIKELIGGSGAGSTPKVQETAPGITPPRTGPAPPPSAMDSVIAPQLKELGQPVPETVVPPPPRLPGTGGLAQAGRDATKEASQGSWPSFLISPEEQAVNEATAAANAKIASTRAVMPALTQLLGPENAQRAVMGGFGVSMPTALKDYQTYTNATGTMARTAIDPAGQRIFTDPVQLPTGDVIPPGSPVTAGWGPQTTANRIITTTDDDGTTRGIQLGTGKIIWEQAMVGRTKPLDRPYFTQGVHDGIAYVWRIDPGSDVAVQVKGPQGVGLEAPRAVVSDPNADVATAQRQQKVIDENFDNLPVTDPRGLLDPKVFKDAEAQRLYGTTYDDILRRVGTASQTPRGGTTVPRPPTRSAPAPTQREPEFSSLLDDYFADPNIVAQLKAARPNWTTEQAKAAFRNNPGQYRQIVLDWWKSRTPR